MNEIKNLQDPFSESGNSTLPSDNSVTESSHTITKSLSCSPDELTTLKTAPLPAPASSAITTHTQAVANTTTANQAQSVTLTSEQNMLPTTTSCYPTHFKQGSSPYILFLGKIKTFVYREPDSISKWTNEKSRRFRSDF